jgi:DNA-binding XRE family transcriptional regulator
MTMARKLSPRIVTVTAATKPLTLRIAWDTGTESSVDLSAFLETFQVFEPLRRRPDVFREVQRGEHGTDVFWDEELDLAADTLWRLACEQASETMSPDAFRNWRERKAYSLETAAKALGVPRHMAVHYERGTKPIPRAVLLATQALEFGYC